MCLIISKPKGVALPIKKHLVEAEKNNPDGIGIAYYKNNGIVRIKKTFRNVHSLYKFLKANITAEDILLIHFRIATSGKVDKGNRHPFPITLNKQLLRKEELSCRFAVAHNGVISQYGGHKKYSDSQKFIIDILANKRIKYNLLDRSIQKLICSYISPDRLSILTYEGNLILLGKHIEDKDGCFYSNDSYEEIDTKWLTEITEYNRKSKRYETKDEYAQCEYCGKWADTIETMKNGERICEECYQGFYFE